MTAPFRVPMEDEEMPASMEELRANLVLLTPEQARDEHEPFSEEIENRPEEVPASDEEVLGLPENALTDEEYRRALEACYGEGFPLVKTSEVTEEDWPAWADSLWMRHSLPVMDHLWLTDRNRKMRNGDQWISSQNKGPWREPPKPAEQARIVCNVIAPALDQRVELISEQRPGFRVEPQGSQSQKNMKRAEGQQYALEYQWRQQRMDEITREACHWNGTDQVSFLHTFWDPDRGPWDEVMIPSQTAQGEEFAPREIPLGDLDTEVLRVEQVRVDAGATATVRPKYWVIRKVIAQATAIKRYGLEVIKGETKGTGPDDDMGNYPSRGSTLGAQQADAALLGQDTVEQFYIYLDKTEYLPQGLMMMSVGRKLIVKPQPLQFGCVPLVRWADGSTDPAFYGKAVMNDWTNSQMLINALFSRLIESVRKNSGGRVISIEGSIVNETLVSGVLSNISVRQGSLAGKALGDMVQPFPSFSVGGDLFQALDRARVDFEQKSGWTDESRGSTSSDESGRAILAKRETQERIFNPPIRASAKAMSEWGKVQLAGMKWGYDTKRMIAVEGDARPDLALALESDDFDGAAEVTIDPETLVPLPRTLRLFMLDQLFQEGVISAEEKRRRTPFAFVQNLDTPDKDQLDRAKRVAEAIRQSGQSLLQPGQPYAILWMDDEAIHQDVLQRELILPDDTEMAIRSAAMQRWFALAAQAQMKMGAAPTPTGISPQQGGKSKQLPAGQQPLMGTNPGVAAGTAAMMAGENNQNTAAKTFEATAPR